MFFLVPENKPGKHTGDLPSGAEATNINDIVNILPALFYSIFPVLSYENACKDIKEMFAGTRR
jgi:hypothetical protein